MRIILASESKFRQRAMDLLGLRYETHPSALDEKSIRETNPKRLTQKLAEAKAQKMASVFPDAIIVSGDAVVSKADRIYEKPRSLEEAAQFLRELSGSEFQFVTALSVMHASAQKTLSTVESSDIAFRHLME